MSDRPADPGAPSSPPIGPPPGGPVAVPVLPVADLVRALAWYERAGFGVLATYDGYALLSLEGTEVHLAEVPELEGQETWTGAYLRVADVDALHARWSALGLAFLAEPTDRPWGQRELALEDPDGNLWRAGTPLPSFDDLLAEHAIEGGAPSAPSAADGPAADGPAAGARRVDGAAVASTERTDADEEPTAPAMASETAADQVGPVEEDRSDGGPGTGLDAWVPLVEAGDVACAGCGLVPGELPARALGAQVRDEVHAFGRVLEAADDDQLRTRPAPATWSALEYAVHVRDVLNVFSERIVRTLAEHEPELGWWDHEAAIADGMANESDVGAVVDDLGRNASKLSEALRLVDDDGWSRGAIRRPGERFTIELMARFALHEVVHHRTDAQRSLASAAAQP